jgi:dUTP pyrophosphatase
MRLEQVRLKKGKSIVRIKVKYCGEHRLKEIEQGNWIDLHTCGDTNMQKGDFTLISLGISMEIPEGYEANIVPRSSTFKNYGIIQTNHYGVIDTSYNGDDDVWRFPAYATRDTIIPDGTRICQFRLNKTMQSEIGNIQFDEVESLGNKNRGGFGSTGN